MTTTQLIELLKSIEFGASGRPREISFYIEPRAICLNLLLEPGDRVFLARPEAKIDGTGDGVAGAELTLLLSGSCPLMNIKEVRNRDLFMKTCDMVFTHYRVLGIVNLETAMNIIKGVLEEDNDQP